MTELEAKLAVHQAAAVLTAGVMSNVVDQLTPDANVSPDAQVQNSMAWQIHKIFYHGIIGALATGDATSWPAPPADKMAVTPVGGGKFDGSVISAILKGAVDLGGPALLQALTPEAIAAIRALIAKIPPPATPAPLTP